VHWDEALERGARLYGIACDDSHYPGFDSACAWVWARCRERSRDAVLEALREGCFYSSAGPELRGLEADESSVTVRCSPAASVTLVCERRRGARANAGRLGYPHGADILERDADGLITAVRLRRPTGTAFARVEVADAAGKRAWTNPLWTA
jgi:hypothetical protein